MIVFYGSSKWPCIIIFFLLVFSLSQLKFSRDLDITKVVFSLSRHYSSHDLDITKVVFSLSRLNFLVITTYFSLDLDITKIVLSCITTYFSRDLDITKVCSLSYQLRQQLAVAYRNY